MTVLDKKVPIAAINGNKQRKHMIPSETQMN